MSVDAVYTNPTELSSLQSSLQKHLYTPSSSSDSLFLNETLPRLLGSVITQFLKEINEKNWKRMHNAIQHFLVHGEGGLVVGIPGLRVLVSLPDGHVAYDSHKTNSWANFSNNSINSENHNSRISIMSALLGNAGSAYELKHSTSDSYKEAYNATRIGSSPQESLGCVRVSVKAY